MIVGSILLAVCLLALIVSLAEPGGARVLRRKRGNQSGAQRAPSRRGVV